MKNHFIPCFYSKRWASSADKKLIRYSRPQTELINRRRFPSQIGYEQDLYTIPGIDDETKYLLETQFFREIDQKASAILDKIDRVEIGVLNEDERQDWAIFLISLRHRNPEKLVDIGRSALKIFNENIDRYGEEYEKRREEGDPTTFDDYHMFLKSSGWFEQTNKLLIQHAILLPQSIKALVSFEWSVLDFLSPAHKLGTSKNLCGLLVA